MKSDMLKSMPVLRILLVAFAFIGCKEELPIVYSERIAILPDKSGLLIKEVRSLDKTHNEMAIKEVVGESDKEVFLVPLADFQDVKFRFDLAHDTILLIHTQTGFEKALRKTNPSAFPIRMVQVSPAEWLGLGTIEGDPIFYAKDKWGAYLDLSRKK